MARFANILETIGNTPVVKTGKLAPPGVDLYVKVEAFNPLGSVKDRLALGVIEDGERSGALRPGQTVVEATSGNTGIGLAMVCAQKGYPLVLTMPDTMSTERRSLLMAYGAELVLTPDSKGMHAAVRKAEELLDEHPDWFMPQQFSNPANVDIHHKTTAEEIWQDTGGKVDIIVAGVGTGGSITGVAEIIKKRNPNFKAIAVEPVASPVITQKLKGEELLTALAAARSQAEDAMSADEARTIDAAAEDVRRALGAGDLAALKAANRTLDAATEALAAVIVERAMEASLRRRGLL